MINLRSVFLLNYLLWALPGINLAQTPATDSSWNLIWQDEFATPYIDPSKWCQKDYRKWEHGTPVLSALRTDDGSNLVFTNGGTVKQIVRRDTGTIQSHLNFITRQYEPWTYYFSAPSRFMSMEKFKHGYFEIRFRLPQLSGNQNHKGIGANFWMYWHDEDTTTQDGSEIDFFESLSRCGKTHILANNVHFKDTTMPLPLQEHPFDLLNNSQCTFAIPHPIDFSTFHKIGVAWSPTHIDYYLDDVPYYTSHFFADRLIAQRIIVDINVFTTSETPDANTLIPYEYEIDYVRVYKLNKAFCRTIVNQCSPLGIQPSVYKSITVGGACNPVVGPSDVIRLRANDGVTINGPITLRNGADFTMDIGSCSKSVRMPCGIPGDCNPCK